MPLPVSVSVLPQNGAWYCVFNNVLDVVAVVSRVQDAKRIAAEIKGIVATCTLAPSGISTIIPLVGPNAV